VTRINRVVGLFLTGALSTGAVLGCLHYQAAAADDDKQAQTETAEEAADSSKSQAGATAKTAESAIPAPQPSPWDTQQAAEDPVEQALKGAPMTRAGDEALQHYDISKYYFGQWQFALSEVELEVTIMYAPNMKIAHRDYSIVSLLRGHPLRSFVEALMTVGICEAVPLTDTERAALMQHASKVHYSKALAYASKSSWSNAISELKWAQMYTPNKAAVTRSLAFCYASSGDFSAAEQQYNKCFALDPDDAFSHVDFAYLLADHGQSGKAEGQIAEALKLAPRAAALHVDMGWLAETKGDFGTAQKEFEQAIKLCPKQPGLWLQLGKVLERAGKVKEAKDAYTQVLAIDSSEDEASKRLQSLKSAGAVPDKSQPVKDHSS